MPPLQKPNGLYTSNLASSLIRNPRGFSSSIGNESGIFRTERGRKYLDENLRQLLLTPRLQLNESG